MVLGMLFVAFSLYNLKMELIQIVHDNELIQAYPPTGCLEVKVWFPSSIGELLWC